MTAVTYKGQYARIEFDPEDLILTGRLAGIDDVVTFHAVDGPGIVEAFKRAVDAYIEACRNAGKQPERPYSGKLYMRVDPSLHAQAARAAELAGMSLNQWGEDVLRRAATDAHDDAARV